MRLESPGDKILDFLKFRFVLVLLLVRMWLVKAWFPLIFPVPVFLKRLAAPLLVFIFGMDILSIDICSKNLVCRH